MKFDSSHISEFKNSDTWKGMAPKARVSRTARRAVETLVTSRTATAASVRVGLRAQLDRLEAKIDRLLEAVEA
jgi:hypothetical protein